MALVGIAPKNLRDGKARSKIAIAAGTVDENFMREHEALKKQLAQQQELGSALAEFIEQFSDILKKDIDGLKTVCAELELKVGAKATQRELLQAIYIEMHMRILE